MPTLTSELDAVNQMLGHIGESPVNSIASSTSLPISASTAQNVLTEVSREVQSEGWFFNYEKNVELIPSNSTITVGEDVLDLDPIDKQVDIVQRGTTLFDRRNNTTTITETIKVNLIRLLEWTSLPETARRYITLRASRVFQGRMVGSRELEALIARDEFQARSRLLESDGSNSDKTIFDNYDTASRVGINRSTFI